MKIKSAFIIAAVALSASWLAAQTNAKTNSSGRQWIAWSATPAIAWEDAFVTGNGQHGTMATGKAGESRIICVHEELFLRGWDRRKIAVPKIANLLPEVRRLSDAGQFNDAANLACNEARKQLAGMGAPQAWSISPHPAFDLNVRVENTGTIAGYRRELNMETGEAKTRWNDEKGSVEESVFSSKENNVNVIRISSSTGRKLQVTLNLAETPGRKGNFDGIDVSKAFRSVTSKVDESGWLTYHAQYANDSGGYEGLARVITKGGQMRIVDNRLRIENADEILVLLRITPLEYGTTSQEAAVRNELSFLPTAYQRLLQPHAKRHGEMFRRVVLDMGCADEWARNSTEKMLADAHEKGITPLF